MTVFRFHHDVGFILGCLALLLFGMVALFSLSLSGGTNYFGRQLLFAGLGVFCFFLLRRVSLNEWRRFALWGLFAVTGLLLLTALIGIERNGARRWLDLGVVSLQSTELLKLFVLLCVSRWSARAVADGRLSKLFFVRLHVLLLPSFFLLALQPDFGSLVLLLALVLSIMFLAGLDKRWIVIGLVLLIVWTAWMIVSEPYRLRRWSGFLDPFADPYGGGYSQRHSLMAFARGGWFGVGLGRSVEKLAHLPEAHNDFIVAIIAEEMGLIGFIGLCAAFLFLVTRAIRIGQRAEERGEIFGALYALGLAALLSAQVLINIGGSLSLLPSKGVTLPLVSYGGSSLLATMLMFTVLLRIDRENRRAEEESSHG